MAYYRTCPSCGANLDPGEVCDCRTNEKERPPRCIGTTPGKRIPDAIIAMAAPKIKEAHPWGTH